MMPKELMKKLLVLALCLNLMGCATGKIKSSLYRTSIWHD